MAELRVQQRENLSSISPGFTTPLREVSVSNTSTLSQQRVLMSPVVREELIGSSNSSSRFTQGSGSKQVSSADRARLQTEVAALTEKIENLERERAEHKETISSQAEEIEVVPLE